MAFEEGEHPIESVDSGTGSTVNKLRLLVVSKGSPQAVYRLKEVGDRFGLFSVEKSKLFSEKFIKTAIDYGIHPTIMLSAGHMSDPEYKVLPEFYRKAQEKSVNLGSHGWVHEAHLLENEKTQEEIVLGSKKLLEGCGISPTGWRAPRYLNGPGTEIGIIKAKYQWDASSTLLLWPKEFDTLTTQQLTNLTRSIKLSGPRNISEQLAVPQIYSLPEGSFVKFFTFLPDDEMLQNRALLNGSEAKKHRATNIMLEMAEFAHNNMELFVQQFHPERINTYYNQLKACFEEINRYGNVQLSTSDQMAEWWRERESITLSLEKRGPDQAVVVCGPERGRAILIKPKERPSNQTQVYGYREIKLSNGYYPGIGLKGTPENLERVKNFLKDFLSESFQANQNYAYVIDTDNASDDHLVAAIRDIISGNVKYPMVMRSRYTPKPDAPDQVYTWAYLLIGDICQWTLKDTLIDTLRQKYEINRARGYA